MRKLSLILPSILTLFFLNTLLSVFSLAELRAVKDAPVELGQVNWIRNFDEELLKQNSRTNQCLCSSKRFPASIHPRVMERMFSVIH